MLRATKAATASAWRPSPSSASFALHPLTLCARAGDAASGGGGLIFTKLRSAVLATAVALSCASVYPSNVVLLVAPNYMLYAVCFFALRMCQATRSRLAVMSPDPPCPLFPRG
ncbi:hypothetical protein GUJ93_ZPchr0003g18450 [Zizania palustris]|uniref:Uncharacterized protein n=1 Tax=Zizania palustris TaxID=103762 RepID=A0A8J5V6J1_ZIZPA|nr:hypothetical protein GUJ93_ZPchr0003g18450 [Zizania palustris]